MEIKADFKLLLKLHTRLLVINVLKRWFDSIVIGRYNKNREQKDRIFVRYLYAPKQRVLYDIINKAKTITLPVVTINVASITRDNAAGTGQLIIIYGLL